MLKSEQNTINIMKEIEILANEKFSSFPHKVVFYEHGHWWAKVWNEDFEYTYDVVDIEENGKDKFDFELVEEIEF